MTRSGLLAYVDELQRANSDELAHYPLGALEEGLGRGEIIIAEENGWPAGYLWHGPLRGGRDATIYQACIDYQLRRRHLGFGLVAELQRRATAAGCSGIRLTCSSSAEANEFWTAAGFYCTAVAQGGRRRGRDLNRYRTDIQPGLWLPAALTVTPSSRPMSYEAFNADRRAKLAHASRYSRTHYG